MKRFIFIIPLFLIASEFQFGGYLNLDSRMNLKDHYFNFNESRLDFNLKASNDNFNFFTEFWVRENGIKNIYKLEELSSEDMFNISLEMKEGYISLSNFPFDFIDLRIGKQRTAWGTAYVFNPTDNMDPLDLEDIWDFESRISSFSLKMNIFVKDFSLQGIYIPFFTPSRLPEERLLNIFYPVNPMVSSVENTIILPSRTKENSIYGIRVKKNILGTDLSVSYVYGRNTLPFPDKITIIPTTSGINVNTELVYPKQQIFGFDFATSFDRFGFWGEIGYFIPESLNCLIDRSLIGLGTSDSLILDKNYYKYVLGADYRYNDIYVLLQYVYGFPYDAGENINDFLLLHSSFKLLESKIELNFNYALEFYNIDDKEFSHLLSPEISFYPLSNIQIKAGLKYIFGDYGNFGKLKDERNVYVIFKYNY